MATNFHKVRDFNETMNAARENGFNNKKLIEDRFALITEEYNELKGAIETNNNIEIRDALADLLYVVYGMADVIGIDANSDFEIVHSSNMSKACKTEEEAIATVNYYMKMYADGNMKYDSPYYEYLSDKNLWIVKNKSNGKILKSIKYTPVKFD